METTSGGGTLVLGGARSGKSSYALELGRRALGPMGRGLFIATARPVDGEMALRIEAHRRERGGEWETLEEPLEVARALLHLPPWARAVVVDCVTLWLSNLMEMGAGEAEILRRARELGEAAASAPVPVILVANEVGMGVVPAHPVARGFRDLAGRVNQLLAAALPTVVLVVAGLPMVLKGEAS